MNYDFETIRDKLTGAHVSDNARRNRLYPTDAQILSTLDIHRQRGALETGHFAWQGDLWSAGLLEYAPLTPRQEKLKANGRGWALRRKLQITDAGKRYLADCRPKADREMLRRYERRFSTSARWVAALTRQEIAPMAFPSCIVAIQKAQNTGATIQIDHDLKNHSRLRIDGKRVRTNGFTVNELHAYLRALSGDMSGINRNTNSTIKLALELIQSQGATPFVTAGRVSTL